MRESAAGCIRWILAFISSRLPCPLPSFTCCQWLPAHLLLVFISRPDLLPPILLWSSVFLAFPPLHHLLHLFVFHIFSLIHFIPHSPTLPPLCDLLSIFFLLSNSLLTFLTVTRSSLAFVPHVVYLLPSCSISLFLTFIALCLLCQLLLLC